MFSKFFAMNWILAVSISDIYLILLVRRHLFCQSTDLGIFDLILQEHLSRMDSLLGCIKYMTRAEKSRSTNIYSFK